MTRRKIRLDSVSPSSFWRHELPAWRARLRRAVVPFLLGLWVCLPALAADDWKVADADIRFELTVGGTPSEPCAGVVAVLPDGGALPRPFPQPVVTDANGRGLPSDCVWFNPDEGLGLVFEPPAEGRSVWVYLRGASELAMATGGTKFCPSLLLYTQMGAASLPEAQQIPRSNPPGRRARFGPVGAIGQMENVFGPDQRYLSYYSGWLQIEEAGRYYVATVSDDGSEARIDGRTVASWPGVHTRRDGAKGQYGTVVSLTPGRHRVEYFHFQQDDQMEANLCWRTPKDPDGSVPRTIPASAYIRSGSANLARVQTRSGVAAALFTAEYAGYLWLKDKPMNLYRFKAIPTEGAPADAAYTWQLDGMKLNGTDFYWIFEGNDPREVTLTTGTGRQGSRSTRLVCAERAPRRPASLDQSNQMRHYRAALMSRCQAVPPPGRPCASWTPDLWATFLGVVEPHEGAGLIQEIFERSRADVIALPPEDRWYLEDIYYETLRLIDKPLAEKWLDRLEKEETDRARKFHWQIIRVEFQLLDVNNPVKARALAQELWHQYAGAAPALAARVLVRMGDIELYSGNPDKAREHYGAAQDRYREGGRAGSSLTLEDVRAGRLKPTEAEIEDWRKQAVRAGSYYEMVTSLIEQHYLFEARKILRTWELEFPLSKLGGDYPIAEAQYYDAIDDCQRVLRITQTYRRVVPISNFLPAAMELELDCLVKLKRTDDVKTLVEFIVKRFPTIPLAKKARLWLEKGPSLVPDQPPGVEETDAERRLREFNR